MNFLKIFIYNIIFFFITIICIEIIFGYWFKEENFGIYMRKERKINFLINEAEVELINRRRGLTQGSSATKETTEEGKVIKVGDFVIITSKTGKLQGTRARVINITKHSYELKKIGSSDSEKVFSY